MLSVCMGWFKKRLYKRRREQLQATFHKNSNNLFLHVITGLELLTEPLEYKGEEYVPLPLTGQVNSVVPTFAILLGRLEFLQDNFQNTVQGGQYRELPDTLSKKSDLLLPRWKDLYFETMSSASVRQQLAVIRERLVSYEHVYLTRSNGAEEDALWRQTQPILRELEAIVEHYL